MFNIILLLGALLGLSAVGFGAYLDHALAMVDPKILASLKTAVRYQQLHAVIIAAIGMTYHTQAKPFLFKLSAVTFILGAILFSFTIYAARIYGMTPLLRFTPAGGFLLMLAWFFLSCAAFTSINKK